MPETIDPNLAAQPHRRLKCPRCGSSAYREPQAAVNGEERLRVVCLELLGECAWEQWIAIAKDGTPRTVEREPTPMESARASADAESRSFNLHPRDATDSRGRRPQCRVPGCRHLSDEGGFCEPHHRSWRLAGRPTDRDGWARRHAEQQRVTGASGGAKQNSAEKDKKEPAMAKQKQARACIVSGCDRHPKGKGLCAAHWMRWYKAGRPGDVAAFAAAQTPVNRKPREHQPAPTIESPQLESPVPPAEPAEPAGASVDAAESLPSAGPTFEEIDLPRDTTRIRVGRVGTYLTITTPHGRVLHQVELGGAA